MSLPGCFTMMRFIFLPPLLILTLSSAVFASADNNYQTSADKCRDCRKRVALVIGNSSYLYSPLKNPVNDAGSMAATLRRLGFEVVEKTNLGYREMNTSVEDFRKKLQAGGVGLFYYAGHGMNVNGSNYLIPVDSQIEAENEVIYKAIDVGLVLTKMEQSKSGVNLIILDACRDNPFSRLFSSTSHGLAGIDVPNSTFISYATSLGNTADDGNGKNGLYTAELVKVLETPGIPLEQLFKRAFKAVREKSGRKQTPCIFSKLAGEFYFIQPARVTEIQNYPERPQLAMPGDHKSLPSAASYDTAVMQEPITCMEFLNIQDDCFRMGGLFDGWFGDDKPEQPVCVSLFSIGKSKETRVSRRR